MKIDTLKSLKEGAQLKLKSARIAAYRMDQDVVTFIRLQKRKGYKTPFVVCQTNYAKPLGFFKPSDF
jgi:hypothetical protein